jgi:hypothetical protein
LVWVPEPSVTEPVSQHVYLDHLHVSRTPYDSDPDFAKILTPYSADNLEIMLRNANLLDAYPELPLKLRIGFPLGHLDQLTRTYAPHNLPSADEHDEVIQEYIASELALDRLSGPFTRQQLETKIGPFRSSPLQVASKEGGPGQPTKYRVCRNLSYKGSAGHSVNDAIDAKDFPTRWGTAEQVANFVSTTSFLLLFASRPCLDAFISDSFPSLGDVLRRPRDASHLRNLRVSLTRLRTPFPKYCGLPHPLRILITLWGSLFQCRPSSDGRSLSFPI